MASTIDLVKTDTPSLFFREHLTRKIGKSRRKDRQWVIRQTLGGITRVSTLGWQGVDNISEGDAKNRLDKYRANFEWNQQHPEISKIERRPICKVDEVKAANKKADAIDQQMIEEQRENLTIHQLWEHVYLPLLEGGKKKPRTVGSEKSLYKKWIKDFVGSRRLIDLKQIDYNRLAKNILSVGRSPRTVHYVVSILLQIWSAAFDKDLIPVQPPQRRTLMLPDIDNERTRAFSVEEAKLFLQTVKNKSQQWHDISLLSLLTGMRAGEIFKLTKQDIDIVRNRLFLRAPKKAKSQYLQISDQATEHIIEMLKRCESDNQYLVVSRKGKMVKEVSDSVQRVIEELKLNEGVDARERLTFHSLRHTTATWLLEQGEDIYRVSKLLRHSTVRVTEQRYAHLSSDTMKKTADKIGIFLSSSEIGIYHKKNES